MCSLKDLCVFQTLKIPKYLVYSWLRSKYEPSVLHEPPGIFSLGCTFHDQRYAAPVDIWAASSLAFLCILLSANMRQRYSVTNWLQRLVADHVQCSRDGVWRDQSRSKCENNVLGIFGLTHQTCIKKHKRDITCKKYSAITIHR